jgi:pyridoxamine 5'-phosphate oxidase-like protein
VHETAVDLRELQRLIDDSYASAGSHLLSIHSPKRRVKAKALAPYLTGVRVLNLATVTARGEPLVGPVDGLFYRGRFWFGSSPDSVRFRHLRARPAVSASYTEGEELAVIVHGTAREVDVNAPEQAGFRSYILEVYGKGWDSWGSGAPYAVIEPRRMFAFGAVPKGS